MQAKTAPYDVVDFLETPEEMAVYYCKGFR